MFSLYSVEEGMNCRKNYRVNHHLKITCLYFILLICILLAFSLGCERFLPTPLQQPNINKLSPSQADSKSSTILPSDFEIIQEAWNMLSSTYVDRTKIDAKKLSEGAVKGMVEALGDPYSSYVDPEMHKLEMNSLRGTYEGIGAYVGTKDKSITIIAPIAGSPAEEANLKPGDKIVKIDGISTTGMSLTEAALKIQGPKGTTVMLNILREGDTEPFEISVIRRSIAIKSTTLEMKETIAHIRLTGFLQNTGSELESALKEAINKGATGIILDLRNNPGGLLDAAVDTSSQFLSTGTVVDVVDSEGRHSPLSVKFARKITDLPVIVLVNKGSASGSEVLAGALQDYGRAKLAGTQTFGKGSVQTIRNLKDGSALHITIARWFTPKGRPIHGVGLTPDFALTLEGDDLVKWAKDYLMGKITS
jgi:carboxyl-terminal processing protease